MNDGNRGLAAQSAVELARLGDSLSAKTVRMISAYLLSVQGLDEFSEKVFNGLSALGPNSTEVYRELT